MQVEKVVTSAIVYVVCAIEHKETSVLFATEPLLDCLDRNVHSDLRRSSIRRYIVELEVYLLIVAFNRRSARGINEEDGAIVFPIGADVVECQLAFADSAQSMQKQYLGNPFTY